jgi:hypothetical protein
MQLAGAARGQKQAELETGVFATLRAGTHKAKKPATLTDIATAGDFQGQLHDLAIEEFEHDKTSLLTASLIGIGRSRRAPPVFVSAHLHHEGRLEIAGPA